MAEEGSPRSKFFSDGQMSCSSRSLGNIDDDIGEATITAVTSADVGRNRLYDLDMPHGAGAKKKSIKKSNGRIPKSATNLQMIYGGVAAGDDEYVGNSHLLSKTISKPEHNSHESASRSNSSWSRNDISSAANHDNSSQDLEDSMDIQAGQTDADTYNSISNSVQDLIKVQCELDPLNTPTVSVQLLRQLMDQTRDELDNSNANVRSNLEYERSIDKQINNPKEFVRVATVPMTEEIVYAERGEEIDRTSSKPSIKTTKRRLYLPSEGSKSKRRRTAGLCNSTLRKIIVEKLASFGEIHISDRHQMIESSRALYELKVKPTNKFLNCTKGNLSKIDAIIERRKNLEAELAGRGLDLEQTPELDFDYLGCLSFLDHSDTTKLLGQPQVLPVELLADDPAVEGKKSFMNNVGLVTRYDKNKISLDLCERKLKNHTALAFENADPVTDEVRRFIRMLEKTGGTDIQLKIGTDIKRNDLPLLEGLNRNTSRLKMAYMSLLGLDKRSKRTTLYKVGKSSESASHQEQKAGQQEALNMQYKSRQPQQQNPNRNSDLSKKKQAPNPEPTRREDTIVEVPQEYGGIVPMLLGLDNIPRAPLSSIALSCREAMNRPSKHDYMRSLGLTSP